jgi:2-oxoglutarate/2-oxoacid ferredoxin oxidoreductase subunit alpha
VLIVGWGSTYGVLREVTLSLNREGIPLRLMHLRELWPFPGKAVKEEISRVTKWLTVENNYSAQLAGLIQEQTSLVPAGRIRKYNGRPFYRDELMEAIRKEVRDA